MPEEFFKVDVHLLDHHKIVDLSDAAFRVFIGSIAYASRLMTDGFVACVIVRRLHDCDHSAVDPEDDWREHARELVEAGLWELVEGGWQIHNFAKHNRTRAKVEQQRAEWRGRQHRHREAVTRDREGPVTRESHVSHAPVTESHPLEVEVEVEVEESKIKTIVERARPASTDTQYVFGLWKLSTGKANASLNGKTGAKRRTAIQRALKDYPLPDVEDAVRGWCNDDWPERVKHNDVTVLLRDAEHIEKFRDLWRDGPPAPGANKATTQAVSTFEAMKAMKPGGEASDGDVGGVDRRGGQAQPVLPAPADRR